MSEPVRVAGLTEQPLSVDRLLAAVQDPAVGGIVVFVGAVRDHDLVPGTPHSAEPDRGPSHAAANGSSDGSDRDGSDSASTPSDRSGTQSAASDPQSSTESVRRRVTALDYSAHPLAAERLAEVAEHAAARSGVRTVAVEHRVGHLKVGDLAVVIAVGAEHRAEAFESCRQLIEELKSGVPIWKQQTFVDGVAEWVGLP